MKTGEILKSCELFEGLTDDEIGKIYSCIGRSGSERTFCRGETVMTEGSEVTAPGIVLSGTVDATKVSSDGRESLVASLSRGGLFGEILSSAGIRVSPITLTAAENCRILFLDRKSLITPCEKACPCHIRIIENLLKIISLKYWGVQNRIDYISAPNLREKLMLYLADAKNRYGKPDGSFTVPMNREKLAAYLNADRSALCRELSAMKRDGLIDYEKNVFVIR